jgi:hypothetical protein
MSGAAEYTTCSLCNLERIVSRKYYHYDIPCDCCNGELHFEIIRYCDVCEASPPKTVTVTMEPIY